MRSALILTLLVGTLVGLGCLLSLKGAPWDQPVASARPVISHWPGTVAADGVVEGAEPERALRPEIDGTLATVHVVENQEVARGTLLAELVNQSQEHQVALAEAELEVAEAQLELLRSGERAETRAAMAALETARHAEFQQAEAVWVRTKRLFDRNGASQEELDRHYYDMIQARAAWEQAQAERALAEASARPEEVAEASGVVAAAEARLRLVQAELEKTRLKAPCDGRVLRIFAEAGELAGPSTARPVLLFADMSRRRVRAFVEELDATRVEVGHEATVRSDGLPGRLFTGVVSAVAPRMGQRAPESDAPGEYKDLYFREVLIDLDAGDELPLNLRVLVRILADGQGGQTG